MNLDELEVVCGSNRPLGPIERPDRLLNPPPLTHLCAPNTLPRSLFCNPGSNQHTVCKWQYCRCPCHAPVSTVGTLHFPHTPTRSNVLPDIQVFTRGKTLSWSCDQQKHEQCPTGISYKCECDCHTAKEEETVDSSQPPDDHLHPDGGSPLRRSWYCDNSQHGDCARNVVHCNCPCHDSKTSPTYFCKSGLHSDCHRDRYSCGCDCHALDARLGAGHSDSD